LPLFAVPLWYGRGAWLITRVEILSAAAAITQESLRLARDAEVAHLDAVLKVNGAKALRLLHVTQTLRQSAYAGNGEIEFKAHVGEEPQVWLDLVHRITMEPDAKTYRVAAVSHDRIDVLLETDQLETLLALAQRILSHAEVKQVWSDRESAGRTTVWSLATLIYVWATGFVAGAALLALLSIYLKKIVF
jgi:hypothetical protein